MKKFFFYSILLGILLLPMFFCSWAGADHNNYKHGLANNENHLARHFEREDKHSRTNNEGNETTGQIAAILLLVANFPVALSLLIKGVNRFMPLKPLLKNTLVNLNRVQKKALMFLHYYLNIAILGIAIWHWLSSRCKSSALPELGLVMMIILITLGFLMKFKMCPKAIRRHAYKIHTQPFVFIVIFLVLTVGHIIVD